MKKDKIIKAGYMMEITSWENDYDIVMTKTIDGLTAEEVKFYLEILYLFRSDGYGSGFGNQSDVDDELLEESINKIVEKYSSKIKFDIDNIFGLLGSPDNHNICFRAYDGAKIYYIPQDFVFADCSEEFNN